MPYLDRFDDIDQYFLFMATAASWRATCRRRRVGCILVDAKSRIRATGYNGVPRNQLHCLEVACPGAEAASGTSLDECYATHAEDNAFLQLGEYVPPLTLYCTAMPCRSCAKEIANTDVTRVVATVEYPDTVAVDIVRWAGITVDVLPLNWDLITKFMEEARHGFS